MSEAPQYRERPFSRPRKSFPRDSNGLVNIDAYLDYLPDDPENVPILINGEHHGQWAYQHVYFQRLFYTQKGVSKFMKDMVLSQFCETPYNQIGMRAEKELELHKTFEEHVIVPPPEAIEKSMIDFKYLDVLGATAIGRRVALVPEAIEYLIPGTGIPRNSSQYSPVERADFFDRELEKTLQTLETPLVTSQRVITGAIKRLARLMNNEKLHEESQRRIEQDEIYFPVRLRSPGFYFHLSADMLRSVNNVETLQTEVDRVELAA